MAIFQCETILIFQFNPITSFIFVRKICFFIDKIKKLICNYLLEMYSVVKLESDILDQMHRRIVRNFLNVVIIMELRKHSMSGYDVISLIHNKFHVLMSPGTVYSYLYFLEKNGLIKGESSQKRRMYELTEQGKEIVETFLNSKDKILGLVLNLFV